MRRLLLLASIGLCAVTPTSALASDVIVQGTTDVRDAGLLNDVIVPGFQAAYPQYTIKYIAVGTGQALTNAQAGQGDAVLTHAPSLEADFVAGGFSVLGRQVFYSDYVILGPPSDPADVRAAATHDAVAAYQAIAAAGAQGTANVVSRGDNSGTNVQEKAIWKLTSVALNAAGEPAGPDGAGSASWYHKAGLGQADTVKLTEQCPFTGGGCYEMTDRGTFNSLVSQGAITGLQVVADRNDASAPGGENLLLNPFSAYAVNPAKVPAVNVDGANAFVAYLTSPELQARLASYPTTQDPAFFADATPAVTITAKPAASVRAGRSVAVRGRIANALPGAAGVPGVKISLQTARAPLANATLATATTDASGGFTLRTTVSRSGTLQIVVPQFGAMTQTSQVVSPVAVTSAVSLRATRRGHRVALRETARPATGRQHAVLFVRGHRQGRRHFSTLKTVRLPARGSSLRQSLNLRSGTWSLQVTYADPGNVRSARSRVVHASVP
jgi:tungstate transport system substrate-binding protein